MNHKLLPLTLILVPLLTGCPELQENDMVNHSTAATSTTPPATVTAKKLTEGDCEYVRASLCKKDEYGLYYSDNTYSIVSQETYNKAKIGDPK